MISNKIKSKAFVKEESGHCIAGVVAMPENNGYRIYVAWEWESVAERQVYGFAKARDLVKSITPEAITETAKIGWDIGGTAEAKKIFKFLY